MSEQQVEMIKEIENTLHTGPPMENLPPGIQVQSEGEGGEQEAPGEFLNLD